MHKIKLSVVIVTYNSLTLLKECLSSLYKYNDIYSLLEVIIVDNKSDDFLELNSFVTSEYSSIHIIRNDKNGGYGQGNNVGINAAKGDIILIMNPDVRLMQPIFKKALNVFDKSSGTIMLGMKQWTSKDSKGISFRVDSPYTHFLSDIFVNKAANYFDKFNPSTMYIVGACFFIRKKGFLDIGLFDENIFMYNEESDIKNRIFQKFGKGAILYNKELNFIHLSSGRHFSSSSDKLVVDSCCYYCKKFNLNHIKILKKMIHNRKLFRVVSRFKKDNKSVDEYSKAIWYIQNLIQK
ncbi:glycosyltransferase [Bacteroides sp.]|uniref:glycosyltransferase n=1 Tax=Bacteroides sp. TaxID=29523 RepID=UPI00260772C6|nr:glycosyltransferase [Bacteroides sp.]